MLLLKARLLDTVNRSIEENAWVRVEGNLVTEIGLGGTSPRRDEQVIDCQGSTLLPGLIDAHAHMGLPQFPEGVGALPGAIHAAQTFAVMERTLHSGVTTVRDAGFTDASFRDAVSQKYVEGPRMFVSNGALSVTGGHSDMRHRHELEPQGLGTGLYWPGVVVNGVSEVRWGAREVLRRGADQIKIMAGGGCISHQDYIDDVHFSPEEIAAAVWEARGRQTHVLAHTYTPESIINAVSNGVRSVEHANLIDEEAAECVRLNGAYYVPTQLTYERLFAQGEAKLGAERLSKVEYVLENGYEGIRIAQAVGTQIGWGSDACGQDAQDHRMYGLEMHARVQGALNTLISATRINAEMMGLGGSLGRIAPGYIADVVVVAGEVESDLAVFQNTNNIQLVMKDGNIVKNTL